MGIIMDASLSPEERKEYSGKTEDEVQKISERKIAEVYISDAELEVLNQKYSQSVVQDFNDEFHYSKEERERMEKEHEKLFRLKNMRNRCPRLSEYVIQWRLCLEIINDMAENNGVMSPDKFKKDVLNGKITINGMRFPKYNGKRKKFINWEHIMNEWVLDTTKDPRELDTTYLDRGEDIEVDEDDELDSDIEKILSVNKKEVSTKEILRQIELGDPNDVATEIDRKEIRKIKKFNPELFRSIQYQEKLDRKRQRARVSIYEVEDDDFDYIMKYDKKRRSKNSSMPEFKGNLMSDKDYEKFMDALEEYDEENTLIKYNGRFYTPDEMREIEVKQMLEENGWNLRKCFVDKQEEKRRKKQKKEDEKKEKYYKKLLMDIQHRKEARDEKLHGLPQGINAKEAKKKLKKKKSKKNKKKIKRFDEILLDASRSMHETIEEYSKEMEDFHWDK